MCTQPPSFAQRSAQDEVLKPGMQAQAPRHGLPRQVLFGAIAGLRKPALTLDFLWQFQLKSLTGLSPGQTHVIQTPIANHAWALPQPQAALPWAHRRPRARNASIVPEGRISLGGSEHAGFVFFRLVEIMTTSKMQPMSRRSAPGINGRSQAETPRPKQHKLVKRKNMYQRHDMFCRGLLQYGVAGTDHFSCRPCRRPRRRSIADSSRAGVPRPKSVAPSGVESRSTGSSLRLFCRETSYERIQKAADWLKMR